MPTYLSADWLKAAINRLGNSRAYQARLFDFLIVKRTLAIKGQLSVAIAGSEPAHIDALEEVGATNLGDAEHYYFNPFAESRKRNGFRPARYASNGTNTTIGNVIWQDIVSLSADKPRKASIIPGYEQKLAQFMLGANEKRPRPNLIDAATWYWRGKDITDFIENTSTDTDRFQRLADAFAQRVGFTQIEISLIFDPRPPIPQTSQPPFVASLPPPQQYLSPKRRHRFPNRGKINISDKKLREIVVSDSQLDRIVIENPETLIALVRNKVTDRDVIALAYRKKGLQCFKRLLKDPDYFAEQQSKTPHRTKEDTWQVFFGNNKWIFGYSLTLIGLSSLEGRKLQQIVAGTSLSTTGKRPDAFMKTRGVINSFCFVEIKHHDTDLLRREPYRSGTWPPSAELTAGISQSHATVHAALRGFDDPLDVKKIDGDPTGEHLYGYDPRSFLVIGNLAQFETDIGVNKDKFRSFELFRRTVRRPEIVTFDELYERARLIVAGDEE
ncbi:MAG: Shedu immune nuclease family protein [Hyphomicrobiaceae bacterium]